MRNLKMDLDDEYGETLSKLELHKNDSEMNRLKKEIAIASTRLQEKQSHLRADQRKLLGLDKTLESLTKRKEIEHQSVRLVACQNLHANISKLKLSIRKSYLLEIWERERNQGSFHCSFLCLSFLIILFSSLTSFAALFF
mmetsp:Transcript_29780/g.41417  ORF Transcript_29780/g.41417 Transcript_29780/m.41417 type:complete len:140 (+) Transcript_29780:813-1232(+)